MHFWNLIPDWNSLDVVRRAHANLELASIISFGLLAMFDVLAHRTEDKKSEKTFGGIGLWFFGVAVVCEGLAYIYGQRNDKLSEGVILSLSAIAGQAATDSRNALTDSASAKIQVGDAKNTAIGAGLAAGTAKDDANAAEQEAKQVRSEVEIVDKHATAVDRDLEMTKSLVSARSILRPENITKWRYLLKGETVTFTSYVNDAEAFWLCHALMINFQPDVKAVDECGRSNPGTPPITDIRVTAPTDREIEILQQMITTSGAGQTSSEMMGPSAPHPSTATVLVGAKTLFNLVQGGRLTVITGPVLGPMTHAIPKPNGKAKRKR